MATGMELAVTSGAVVVGRLASASTVGRMESNGSRQDTEDCLVVASEALTYCSQQTRNVNAFAIKQLAARTTNRRGSGSSSKQKH